MIGIILHHIHNRLGLNSPVLSQIGFLATGFFFFISGYGNFLSMKKNSLVQVQWLSKKIFKIYIPFLVVYVIYYASNVMLYPTEVPTFTEVLQDVLTVSVPNQVSWFPKIILACFFVHWLIKRFCRKELYQIEFALIVTVVYVLCMRGLKLGPYWYNTVMCYPVGMLTAHYRGRILSWFKDDLTKRMSLVGAVAGFGILFLATKVHYLFQIPCALSFSVMCFVYTIKYCISEKWFTWIGNNSFEFYLFHVACVQIFCFLIPVSAYAYTACVFGGSGIMVYLYLQIKKMVTVAAAN